MRRGGGGILGESGTRHEGLLAPLWRSLPAAQQSRFTSPDLQLVRVPSGTRPPSTRVRCSPSHILSHPSPNVAQSRPRCTNVHACMALLCTVSHLLQHCLASDAGAAEARTCLAATCTFPAQK